MMRKLAQFTAAIAVCALFAGPFGELAARADDWLAKSRGEGRGRYQAARYQEPVPPQRPAVAQRPAVRTASQVVPPQQAGAFRLGEAVQPASAGGQIVQGEAVPAVEEPGFGMDEGPIYDGQGGGCPLMFDSDRGVFFAGADYLYVRPTFSEATAYARIDNPVENSHQELIQHEFEYRSSPRIFFGYRRLDCHGEVRFTYTNFNSTALAESGRAPKSLDTIYSIEPELQTSKGEHVLSAAHLDANLYDLDISKTICVGTPTMCECLGRPCAPWDITFSFGARVADVEWQNQGKIIDRDNDVRAIGETEMLFNGAGPRVGLEGRRYFGQKTRFSLFGRTNFSLLLGHYELVSRQVEFDTDDTDSNQLVGKRMVPVTEMEFGGSIHIRQRATISGGYLWQVWHDLGMPQQFGGQFLPYDDANILSFDGFFIRGEWTF